MPAMTLQFCASCGKPFQARVADVNRGWGIFCSKTCKGYSPRNRPAEKAKAPKRNRKKSARKNIKKGGQPGVFNLSSALDAKIHRMENPINVEPSYPWDYDDSHGF